MSEKDYNEFENLLNTENSENITPQEASDNINKTGSYDYSPPAETEVTAQTVQPQPQVQPYAESRPQSYYERSWNTGEQFPYPHYIQYRQNNVPKYNTYGTEYPLAPQIADYYRQQPAPEKKKKEKKVAQISKKALALVLSLSILASALLGFGGGMIASRLNVSETTGNLTIYKVDPSVIETSNTESGYTTAQITQMTADSVVEIVTEIVQTASFYQQYITSGAGSGVIISGDGYIITNNHVIEDATKITVTLRDGNSYDAELVGSDSEIDVALLKINADEELTVATFGDSSAIQVGDKTVVIGNPLGQLGGTVTDGIISALDRDVTIDGKTMSLMQTNAAINPGNSGGGMFNDRGELIGLVVAKSAGSKIEGLGFAIPINDVIDVLNDLMQYGYVRGRVSLGVSLVDITTQQMAMMYGVSELGCYISSVELNSNASSAGLQSGDRIIAINGKNINSAEDVVKFMDTASVGDTVEITVARNGRTGTLSVVLEEDTPDGVKPENNNGFNSDPFSGGDQYSSIIEDIIDNFGF